MFLLPFTCHCSSSSLKRYMMTIGNGVQIAMVALSIRTDPNPYWVTVQTSSATRDLMLIQQKKFYWICNRSGMAELVCTATHICTGCSAFWDTRFRSCTIRRSTFPGIECSTTVLQGLSKNRRDNDGTGRSIPPAAGGHIIMSTRGRRDSVTADDGTGKYIMSRRICRENQRN